MADEIPCDCGHSSESPKDCEDCKRRFCAECYEEHALHMAKDDNGKIIKAQLFETLSWFCPSCGHQNTMKLIRQAVTDDGLELSEAEEIKLRAHLELEDWEPLPPQDEMGGVVLQIPTTVSCHHCRLLFGTLMPPAIAGDLDLSGPEDFEDEEDDDIDFT